MPHTKIILQIKNLYIKCDGNELLNEVNFTCKSGDSVSISGGIGSGKSSLLNVLGLLAKPESGEIYLHDDSIDNKTKHHLSLKNTEQNKISQYNNYISHKTDYLSLPRAEQDEFMKYYFGYIFHEPKLMSQWNLIDNIALPLIAKGKTKSEIKEIIDKNEFLKDFSESDKNKPVAALSAGQRKLISIARALIKEPKILIADEPISNFDSGKQIEVAQKLVAEAQEKNMIIIAATHLEAAQKSFTEKYLIEKKSLVDANPTKLFKRRQNIYKGKRYKLENS
ncbi:ATP-binding cassette domain-containing protein [Candidatus Halobeggiatoa sp. HSG11]|nr:ATP-binding cassette domain-containing protein [Candidatus Halobeggiatoa sp. HSG11]